jgi:hypothetical protein
MGFDWAKKRAFLFRLNDVPFVVVLIDPLFAGVQDS